MKNVVKVPKPMAEFNPNRPLHKNTLLTSQVRHFREAELQLPAELQSGMDAGALRTEGEASEYIRRVTRAIHRGGGRAPQRVETAR